MTSRTSRQMLSLAIGFFLLLTPLSLEACQTEDAAQEPCCSCCCCQDLEPSSDDDAGEEQECGCQMNRAQPEEDLVAISVSRSDDRQEIYLRTFEAESKTEDYESPLIVSVSQVSLPSRDQPLFILHSSLLI